MTVEESARPWCRQNVVVITAGGTAPYVMVNALAAAFPNLSVLRERPESKRILLRRRARRLGRRQAIGQLGTMVLSRLGKRFSTRRTEEILRDYGGCDRLPPGIRVIDVESINEPAAHQALADLSPSAVLTISCRILTPLTLSRITCPVVNFHAGINPTYRGQMGGYWSLVEGDAKNFGATVHLVDAGIDTGSSLYERRLAPSPRDTMTTYPLLLTAGSTDIAIRALDDALGGSLRPYRPDGPSVLRYNPPIWTWLWYGLSKGIW